jgi:hypothetical protein
MPGVQKLQCNGASEGRDARKGAEVSSLEPRQLVTGEAEPREARPMQRRCQHFLGWHVPVAGIQCRQRELQQRADAFRRSEGRI